MSPIPHPEFPARPEPEEDGLRSDAQWKRVREMLRDSAEPPLLPDAAHFAALRSGAMRRIALERRASPWRQLRERFAESLAGFFGRGGLLRGAQLAGAAALGALLAIWVLRPTPDATRAAGIPAPDKLREGARLVNRGACSRGGLAPESLAPGAASVAPGDLPAGLADIARTSGGGVTVTPSSTSGRAALLKSVKETAAPPASEELAAAAAPAATAKSLGEIMGVEKTAESAAAGAGALPGPAVAALAGPSTSAAMAEGPRAGDPALTATGAGAAGATAPFQPTDVMEAILRLKTKVYLSGDDRYWDDVRQVESAIMTALERSGDPSGKGSVVKAMRGFQQAERAVTEKRYGDAVSAYSQVAAESPNNLYAFLAHFQLANIWFEQYGDFASALREYQICIEQYPSHYISEDRLSLIHNRVDLLMRTSENDWAALKLSREAQKSGPEVAALRLIELIERYPTSPLAGASARALAELAAQDPAGSQVDPARALKTLQEALQANSNSSNAPEFQFAIGDIFQRRLFDPRVAAVHFNRVLQMNPSESLAALAHERLRELYQQRASTPTP